jgi:hypothetical protein
VASGHDLRELFDVSAQGVQVGTGGPHFLEFDLLVGVEVVGAAADPAGNVADFERCGDGGWRGLSYGAGADAWRGVVTGRL